MIEFYYPTSQGEWAAFAAAAATLALGLWRLVAVLFDHYPNALVARAQLAGFQMGAGVICMLLAQPLIYLALGAGWTFAALAQIVAMARHTRAGAGPVLALLSAIVLAAVPAAYGFGLL